MTLRTKKRGSNLDLLRAPVVVLAHVRGWLYRGNVLEDDVSNTDEADDRAGDVAQDTIVQQERADEDVDYLQIKTRINGQRTEMKVSGCDVLTGTSSQEGEEKRRVPVHVIRDLWQELQAGDNWGEEAVSILSTYL